jgi:isopentenyl diphosphate isomerase/L-lactate dehydrogenase-like FMN-dependent dehydrogenase
MSLMRFQWRGERLISVDDYRAGARSRLPRMVWSFVDGGADDQVTVRDNRSAFSRWSFAPKALVGFEQPDLTTTVGGVPLEMPVLLAPTGLTGLTHWRGDIAAARSAEHHGVRYVLSTFSSWSMEEVASATEQDHFFQLYPKSGELTDELMKRAWQAGYRVMFVTIDCPVMGNRESERRNGMGQPPILTPRRALNAARHPRWVYDLFRHQRISGRNVVDAGGMRAALESAELQSREFLQSRLNWADVRWIRERWPGAMFAKGILSGPDATRAVDAGFDGVVVSNHGGRQLDFARASLDCLTDVVAAVGDRAEVLLDGGVRRGSDILKALALGARAVMIGRPYLYGLAVDGERGVDAILDILRAELSRTMVLAGIQRARDPGPGAVVPREQATSG